jgi:hypothetical protein
MLMTTQMTKPTDNNLWITQMTTHDENPDDKPGVNPDDNPRRQPQIATPGDNPR